LGRVESASQDVMRFPVSRRMQFVVAAVESQSAAPHLMCASSCVLVLLLNEAGCQLGRFPAALRAEFQAMAGVMRGGGAPIGQWLLLPGAKQRLIRTRQAYRSRILEKSTAYKSRDRGWGSCDKLNHETLAGITRSCSRIGRRKVSSWAS